MARISPGSDTAAGSLLFQWRRAIAESELSSSARLVAWTLSLHMDLAGGSCWPAISTLVHETGLNSDRTVHRALGELKKAHFLRIDRTKGGRTRSGAYRTNGYRAILPDPRGPATAGDDKGAPQELRGSTEQELRGSTEQELRGSIPATEASNPAFDGAIPAAAADEEVQEEVTTTSSARACARDDRESQLPNNAGEIVNQRIAELDGPLTQDQAYLVAKLARREPAFRRQCLPVSALVRFRAELLRKHGPARGDFILSESLRQIAERERSEPVRNAMGLLRFQADEVGAAA
jgi:hypothetical protein